MAGDKSVQRVAVITGAGSGIGKGIAERLARKGYRIIAIDCSESVHMVVSSLHEMGHAVEAVVLNVTDESAVRNLVASIVDRYDRLDILVNNAGIHPKINGERASALSLSTEVWNEVLAVNITAPFVFSREAVPAMRRNGWGRIINMSSRAGRMVVGTAGVHYATAKAGMIGMTRVLASEVAPFGITANCIAPGRIETPLTAQGSAEQRTRLVAEIPVGRIGIPDEIGHAVEFLASEESAYITGAVLDVNGGTFMP